MKKQNLIALIVCVVFVAVLALTLGLSFGSNSKVAVAEESGKSIKVAHISDLHFYPEELSNMKSEKYLSKLQSESKFIGESGASIRKTFEDMLGTAGNIKDDIPDFVLVSGDLTLNGELEGHQHLVNILKDVTEMVRADEKHKNFQILLIPGNHDLFNVNAMRYYPTEDELNACQNEQEREELLRTYGKSAPTTDNQQFMDIYWSFGYAPAGEVNPRTGEVSTLSSNISLEFFYDSEFWYEDNYGVDTVHPPKDVHEYGKDTKDYSVYNQYVRHGACSYIARTSNATIVAVDGNSRKYIGESAGLTDNEGNLAFSTADDWKETTSGDLEDRILRWLSKSLEKDVQDEKLVVGMLHHNVVPHFTMEGDVLSMFTYDDYKKAIEVLADMGLRYVFTGHMHASDVAYQVSQNGNIIYDFEVGTTIGLGAAYRLFELTSTGSGSTYAEDAYTQVINLDTSFEYYTADSNEPKQAPSHYAYFKNKMENMVPNIVGSIVNEGLYKKLTDAVSGLNESHPFIGSLATDAIKDLSNFDLYPLEVKNGVAGVKSQTQSGYDLVALVNDLVAYLSDFDFSYGTVNGGYKLKQVIFDVYGGHLLGTNPNQIPQELVAFFGKLEDGTFVQWLVDLLYNTVIPQLDLIFDAPIRVSSATKTLEELGVKGFDLTDAFERNLPLMDGFIRNLVVNNGFYIMDEEDGKISVLDENGNASLRILLYAISKNAPTLLETIFENPLLSSLLEGLNLDSIKETIDKYFGLAMTYLSKYFDSNLSSVIKTELLDKYVTKAFCVNLGVYAKNIVESLAVDQSYDGGYFDENGTLCNEKVHLEYSYSDGTKAFGGHSYNNTKVDVVPTADNGLIPAQVSIANVTKDGVLSSSEMKFQWTTHITVDLFSDNCPDSFIKFATSEAALASQTAVKATGKNVQWEYPTIDFGIMFLNMSFVYDTFNLYNVQISGLSADTVYYYVLGSDATGWTDVRSFKTPKASNAQSFTIMGITDIQGSIENNYVDSLPNLMIGKDTVADASIVINLGDNVDNGKNIYQYYWMLEGQKEFWSSMAYVGVPGNHEDGENELSTHVKLPNETTGKEYYSFIYVNTMFIMLNTNDLAANGQLSATQTTWLTSTLQSAKDNESVKWIVVGMHKGPYTAGSHAYDNDVIALRGQLTPIFAEYGVNVVLQGHDHTYSVTNPVGADGKAVEVEKDSNGSYTISDGVIYINLGTMGDKFYDYLYTDAIDSSVFVKRDSVDKALNMYLTSDKYLELKETPVFISLSADAENLTVKTYTVVNGNVVSIDNINITTNPVYNQGLTVIQVVCIAVGCAAFVGILAIACIMIVKKKKVNEASSK